jgi:MutS domain V
MKALLMNADSDFDPEQTLPDNAEAMIQDLELATLFEAMAAGDQLLFEIARRAILLSLTNVDAIAYRQRMLSDCLENPAVLTELYELAGQALAAEKTVFRSLSRDSPSSIARRSVQVLLLLVACLQQLRALADEHAASFGAPGFRRFFSMIPEELDDDYLGHVEAQLTELQFESGMVMSVQLGSGNHGKSYVPRRGPRQGWFERISLFDRTGYSFTIPDRDESGFRALRELEDQGLNSIANALAQSCDHVLSFFTMLRLETGFYVACLNLRDQLRKRELPVCFPVLEPLDKLALQAGGLYDASLAMITDETVVGNDVGADNRSLLMITGANQGGKSTFLRSVGTAQLMTQAGMFVAAHSLHLNVVPGVFTHFKREEDEAMESGKLDEELRRMSDIADHITPGCLLLCNESFASTNEREGSEIARQVVRAMLHERIKLVFVTHQFDLASGFFAADPPHALFLRAARENDGRRSYKIAAGEPLPTSYGEDAYRKVFGADLSAS